MKKYIVITMLVLTFVVSTTLFAASKIKAMPEINFSTEFDSPNFDNVAYERIVDTKNKVICYSQINVSYSTSAPSSKGTNISCLSNK